MRIVPWEKPNCWQRESSINTQNVSLKEEYKNLSKKDGRVKLIRLVDSNKNFKSNSTDKGLVNLCI